MDLAAFEVQSVRACAKAKVASMVHQGKLGLQLEMASGPIYSRSRALMVKADYERLGGRRAGLSAIDHYLAGFSSAIGISENFDLPATAAFSA
jgi:hypothetical protein